VYVHVLVYMYGHSILIHTNDPPPSSSSVPLPSRCLPPPTLPPPFPRILSLPPQHPATVSLILFFQNYISASCVPYFLFLLFHLHYQIVRSTRDFNNIGRIIIEDTYVSNSKLVFSFGWENLGTYWIELVFVVTWKIGNR